MDLTVVYSKTAKGLRARSSLIGGLSSQLMKVLSHVDGTSKAETILFKYDEMTEQGLAAALIQLETEGYIKPVLSTRPSADEWSPATIFAPMEVEEVVSVEDAEAQAAEQARSQAEYKAKIKEEVRLQAERKAREKEEQEYAKEKVKAEAKVKAQLEAERIAREAEETQKKADEEALAKAEEKAKLEAERKVKIEQEARQKAELKAQEAAERKVKAEEEARISAELVAREKAEKARVKAEAELKAHREAELSAQQEEEKRKLAEAEASARAEEARAKAQAEAKENARLEIERIAREAKETQKKSEMEASAKAEEAARLEAECVAKAEADAKLEAERVAKADEDARLEAERKAIKEDEARLKAESEAKAEAEKIRAKTEAEEKIKAEEKERARLDIARIVREAEEARKKSEAEAKEARLIAKQKGKVADERKKAEIEANAKTKLANKLEAERKNKSDEDARLEAEIKEKAQADQNRTDAEAKEKASVDVNLKASLAMQSFVTDAEEAQKNADFEANMEEAQLESGHETNAATSLKAEIKAELKVEQVRAKIEADEKALAEEKEIARREMERISREAELERQKQHPEASAAAPVAATTDAGAIEVRWANPDEDDDDEDFEEEERIAGEVEKVGLEIKKKTKRVAEVEGRLEIIRAAKEEAEVKAKSKVQSRALAITKILGKCAIASKKAMLIYLPLVILLIIGVLHLVNISPLVAPIEKLASESLGTPVLIEEVRASLWPQPHLVLRNVAIGANSSQKIETLNIVPDTSSLSEEVKVLRSLELEGLKIEQENFGQPLQWVSNLSKAQHLLVKQIALKKIVLKIHDLELAAFDGKVTLTESRELKSIDLTTDDETLAIQITPQGSSFDIAFTGTNWALPMNPKFVFSELKAKGTIKQSLIFFNQIEAEIYGGSLTGKAALDWSNQWSMAGNFDLINASLPKILNAFGSGASVDGKFNLTGIFSCKSKLAAALTDAPEISANFTVQNGKINGVELDRAVLSKSSQSLAGDSTSFDKLTGSMKIKNGAYQYRQVVLKSDQFYAEGNVDIKPNQDISGKITANLAAQSRRLQARFDLAGKVNNVKRQ